MKKLLIKLMAFALIIACTLGVVACGSSTPPEGGPSETSITLVESGRSNYKIIIPEDPSPVEKTASGELQKYIKLMTGAKLPIVNENAVKLSVYEKYISIGETKLKEKANINNKNLNSDGYVIQTVADTLFIVGENGSGTMFGVYGFLDDYCGIKFLTAAYEYIPEKTTLALPEISDVQIPAVANRTMFADNTEKEKIFNYKLLSKAYRLGDCIELGGKYGDMHKLGVHSLGTFIYSKDYYDYHPEWWGNKEDYTDRNVPCFTNGLDLDTGRLIDDPAIDPDIDNTDGEVLKYYLEAVIKKFKRLVLATSNPVEYYVLGQPDSQTLCSCQNCLDQLETLDSSRTAQFMIWSNAVAKEIDEWIEENYQTDPRLTVNGERKQINFLRDAYQWSIAAPVKKDAKDNWVPYNELCRPARNMGVYFIPITGCFLHSLLDESCTTNQTTVGLYFKQWMSICDSFGVFTYNTDYRNFPAWFPCLSAFSDDIRSYVDAGITGLIMEGALAGGGTYYQQDMMTWTMAKMLWDPTQNYMDLVSEFNKYYYGEEAGKIIDDMVMYMQAHSEIYAAAENKYLGVYSGFVGVKCLTQPYIETLYTYVDRVKAIYDNSSMSAEEKEEFMLHLDAISVQVDYMKYKNYDQTFASTQQEKYAFMVQFFDKCERVGIKAFTEGGTSIQTLRQQQGY